MTCAPARAKVSAIDFPIPREPPVTRAVRASAPAGAQFRLIGVDLLEVAPAPAAPSTTVVVDLVAPAAAGSGDITEGRSALVEPAVVYAGVHWRLRRRRSIPVANKLRRKRRGRTLCRGDGGGGGGGISWHGRG